MTPDAHVTRSSVNWLTQTCATILPSLTPPYHPNPPAKQMSLRRRAPAPTTPAAPPTHSLDDDSPGTPFPPPPPQAAAATPSPIAGLPNSLVGASQDGPLARLVLVLHRVELTPEPPKWVLSGLDGTRWWAWVGACPVLQLHSLQWSLDTIDSLGEANH